MGAADIIGRLEAAGVRLTPLPPDKIAAAPRSLLTDEIRELIRRHKADLLASLLACRTCEECRHAAIFFTQARKHGENDLHITCSTPVEAGLATVFQIVYPNARFATQCVAFSPRTVQ
jgi:hypothetical protein